MNTNNIFERIREQLSEMAGSTQEHQRLLELLKQMEGKQVNLLVTGPNGSGKSSTINSLFNMRVAEVGVGVDPQTKDIDCYKLENLVIWDTPGFGDSESADREYARQIISKLEETDNDGNLLIDVVLVVLDASSKDMGTAYRLIGETILPHLDSDAGQRILVAVNQADVAMKGNHWDYEKNLPDETLQKFLEEKVSSIQRRILESTGLQTDPIYYCAGYTDENGEQRRAYNLNKLLLQILRALKSEKVLVLADNINEDESMWTDDDGKENYSESIARSFGCIIKDCIDDGFETGGVIGGMIAGIPGAIVGMLVGAIGVRICGLFKGLLDR